MKSLVKIPLVLPYAVVELTQAQDAGCVDSLFFSIVDAENHARYWSRKAEVPFIIVGQCGVLQLYVDGTLTKFDVDWFSDLIEVKWMVS